MVNLKTKSDKHANDNEKRRQSIKEREKAKLNQSQIIKNALSTSALNNSSKKIVFSDDENNADAEGSDGNKKNLNGSGKAALFDSSESENEDFELREQTQFTGKKGFELLNLQSTYGNDERFKIDERFLEDEERDDLSEEQNKSQNDEGKFSEEKATQLKILGSVLGTPVGEPEKEKKAKKRTYEMIRYDASKKEHKIYEIKTQSNAASPFIGDKQVKTKKERKRIKTDSEDSPKPKVSKEKFYKVSSEIKNSFKEKKDVGQFSLLQTYGLNGVENKKEEIKDKEIELEEDSDDNVDMFMNEENFEVVDEQNVNKINDKGVNKQNVEEKTALAKGIWKESFFFVEDDVRFQEALQFVNKKHSAEAMEAAENYSNTRRKLKEILRLHLKKQIHKKDPFKNKIGGMSKKQLANSKLKNSKMKFNKRKPLKKSPGGKI